MALAEIQTSISAPLRLVEIEGKGRGLVASQPLKGGQIVLQESPILAFTAFPLKHRQEEGVSYSRYCAHCYRCLVSKTNAGAAATTVLTCPLCSHPDDAIFCSSICQSLALNSTHTPWLCQTLSYLRNCPLLLDHRPEECQIQARYLVAAYNLAIVSPSAFQNLLSLHGGGVEDQESYMDTAVFLHSIFSLLSFPDGFSAFSVEMTAALLAKESCNSFSLMEPFSARGGRSARAYGIYPRASFFNHDCLPNACRFDYLDSGTDGNTDIIIRMIHDVPEGQEICLSYFRVNLSYCERKKRLLDYFGFACHCERCKVESSWFHEDGKNEIVAGKEDNETMIRSDGNNNDIEHEGNDDSPPAYFFVRFVCDKENCGGTLAPLPPSDGNPPNIMECNFCGCLKRTKL